MKKVLLLLVLVSTVLFTSETGTVVGLDPNGDGFLSLRKKPKSTEIGRLYNGDTVQILDRKGKWYRVKDLKSNRVGYSHSNWIKINTNSHSERRQNFRSNSGKNNDSSETQKPLDSTYAFAQKKSVQVEETPKEKPLSNTFNFSQSKPSSNDTAQKQIPSSKVIVVTGYGVDKEKALKSAFKSAVEQYVGVLVDADTVVKNNTIIKDEILTASNGYIQSYDEISTENDDGLVQVKIRAVVKSQEVFNKVKSLNIATVTISDSKNIYARVVSKKSAKEDAAKILRKSLNGFYDKEGLKKLLVLGIRDVKVDEESTKDNKVPVTISYVVKINNEVYKQEVKKLELIFKGLGAKLYKRVDLPKLQSYHRLSVIDRNRVRKLTGTDFGFIKHYGNGYKLDIWKFPASWSDIYPFNNTTPLKWQNYFNIILEIKKSNGNVLVAAKVRELRFEDLLKCTADNREYKPPYGSNRSLKKPKIIAPFFWDVPQKEATTSIFSFEKVSVNLKDIIDLGSVTVELDEK